MPEPRLPSWASPRSRARASVARAGFLQRPAVLASIEVSLGAATALHGVARPGHQHFLEFVRAGQRPGRTPAGSARHVPRQPCHDRLAGVGEAGPVEIGGEQPDPTRDVEAHSAG